MHSNTLTVSGLNILVRILIAYAILSICFSSQVNSRDQLRNNLRFRISNKTMRSSQLQMLSQRTENVYTSKLNRSENYVNVLHGNYLWTTVKCRYRRVHVYGEWLRARTQHHMMQTTNSIDWKQYYFIVQSLKDAAGDFWHMFFFSIFTAFYSRCASADVDRGVQ